jgi:MbtH protein
MYAVLRRHTGVLTMQPFRRSTLSGLVFAVLGIFCVAPTHAALLSTHWVSALASVSAQSDEDEEAWEEDVDAVDEDVANEDSADESMDPDDSGWSDEESEPSDEEVSDDDMAEDSGETGDTAAPAEDAGESATEPPAPEIMRSEAAPGRSAMSEEEDPTIYKVVINHEEQYSIWPADRENALGWSDAGKTGTKQECLDYIKEVWTDMRPLSLRKKLEEQARGQ